MLFKRSFDGIERDGTNDEDRHGRMEYCRAEPGEERSTYMLRAGASSAGKSGFSSKIRKAGRLWFQ